MTAHDDAMIGLCAYVLSGGTYCGQPSTFTVDWDADGNNTCDVHLAPFIRQRVTTSIHGGWPLCDTDTTHGSWYVRVLDNTLLDDDGEPRAHVERTYRCDCVRSNDGTGDCCDAARCDCDHVDAPMPSTCGDVATHVVRMVSDDDTQRYMCLTCAETFVVVHSDDRDGGTHVSIVALSDVTP